MTDTHHRRTSSRSLLAFLPLLGLGTCTSAQVPAPSSTPTQPASVAIDQVVVPVPQPMIDLGDKVGLFGVARQGALLKGRLLDDGKGSVMLNGVPIPVAADGSFIIAFDRDAENSASLRIVLGDGTVIDKYLPVAPGQWAIQNVDASPTGGVTTEAFKELRGPELAAINGARAAMSPTSSDGWRQNFIWPVMARKSGVFGSQRIYRGSPGSYHSGVDLAAPAGATYVAPADGVVILAADHPFTLEGNLLMIDHGMGLSSAFLHSQRLLVKLGETVRQGQPIGIVGATGRASGPHLHWA